MVGELILSSYTYDQGRVAINDSFSGTAYLNNISGYTLSATTIYSGGTNLGQIFQPVGANTVVANGTNTYTGGTFFNQTINVSALTINTLIVSGSSQLGTITAFSLSGGTISGNTIYSAGTNLYSVIKNISREVWSSSTGNNSIISTNNGNLASGNTTIAFGLNNIAGGINSCVFASNSNTIGISSGIFGGDSNIASDLYSFVFGGSANIASGASSVIIGGQDSISIGLNSVIAGGESNVVSGEDSFIGAGKQNYTICDYSAIIGSSGATINGATQGTVILGMSSYTANSSYTTHMEKAYINGFIDLNPLTVLPIASIGRIFFSGSPLFRLMQCTGNTSADWIIV